MNVTRIGVALAAPVTILAGCVATPPAAAAVNPALNGIYTATTDGVWAKTNEVFHDEDTEVSTWTIASSCTGAYDCTGTVTTDHGWSAEIVYISRMWFVTRTLDGWEKCADSTAAPGKQIYKFYEDPTIKGKYVGWDTTAGPSGACGVNRPLFVEIPFTLLPK